MIIDRYTKFILTIIAVSLFLIAINMTFAPLGVHAQEKNMSFDKDTKTFKFEATPPNLEALCLEMQGLAFESPELTFSMPEFEITWPEFQKLCGME